MPQSRLLAPFAGLLLIACAWTASAPADAGVNAWTFHGPIGGGGKGTAVAVHPTNTSIVMLGTPRGINRSTDGGNNWTLVSNDTFSPPTEIAFDPSGPSRVVATDGQLLYLSVDTGLSFTRLQAPATGNIAKLAFGQTGRLYVGLASGRLFKATSPFTSWTEITGSWAANSVPDAITVDPSNANVIWLGIGDNGLYRSDNDGMNWSGPLTNGFDSNFAIRVHHIAVNPANSDWIVAATGQSTWVSQNKGATWNRSSDIFSTFWVGFDPNIPNAVVAMRGYEVMRSGDNGLNFTVGLNLRANSMTRPSFVPGATGRLLLANANGLAITNYNLNSYTYGLGGLTGVEVRDLSASDDGTIYAAMASGNADVFRRYGSEFLPLDYLQTLPATTTTRLFTTVAVFPGNAQQVFAVNNYTELIRTFDGGAHWTPANSIFNPNIADFTTDVGFDPGNAAVVYVSREPSGIWKSTDSGANFALLVGSPGSAHAVAVSPHDSQVIYVAAAPNNEFGIYKSIDGGQTWVQQLAPSGTRKFFRSFSFHPTQPNTVYANSASISYQTTNGGASWTPIVFPGLVSTSPIEGMFFDRMIPTTMVAISSAAGFFRSVDGGATWKMTSFSSAGNNPAYIWSGVVDPSDPAVVIVGTNSASIGEYRVAPDLALAMTAIPSQLPVGGSVASTFTVSNPGLHDSSASELRIDVPSWITPSGPGCTRTGQTLRCAFAAIKVGESRGVQVSFAVDASAPGSGQINATLTGHEADAQTANNIAAQSVSASEMANLSLGFAVSKNTLEPGESMTLTMAVANDGPSPSTQTTVDLPIPAGIEVTGYTSTQGTCAVNAGTFHCDVGTLPVSIARIINVDLRAVTPGTRDISAHADGAGTDSGLSHTNHFVLRVLPIGDLGVSLAESADPVTIGEDFSYTVTVKNLSGDAAGAIVPISVTGTTIFRLVSASGMSCPPALPTQVMNCEITSLPAGATATAVIGATALLPGIATATATATHSGRDTNPDNNSATLGTTLRLVGDLSVEISDSVDPATVSVPFQYTVTVRNNGPNNPAVSVAIPVTGANISSAVISYGSCTTTAGTVTCTIPQLDSGGSQAITITASAAVPGTASATATASLTGFDPNTANNSATAQTDLRAVADIGVTIAESADPVTAGGVLTYLVTLTTAGPSPGNVHLTVPVTGSTVTGATPSQGGTCTITAGSVTCDFVPMDLSPSTVNISINSATAGTVTATATATFSGTDPVATNNTASATTTVNAPSSSGSSSGGGSGGGGGGGGRFDWLALMLLGGALAARMRGRSEA